MLKKRYFVAVALLAFGSAGYSAEEVTTNPVGINEVTLLGGAETVVSVPFLRQPLAHQGAVTTVADGGGAQRVQLTAAGTLAWGSDAFANTHYVRFLTGAKAGHWYDVVNSGSNTLMLDTAGDNVLGSVAQGDTFVLVQHWTLDSLFPPADQQGDDRVIHRSPTHLIEDRRTEVELPNLAEGVNLPAGSVFYLVENGWRTVEGESAVEAGGTIIPPGTNFTIRHLPGHQTTTFRPSGLVLMTEEVVPLATSATGRQDNEVAISRPIPVALSDSGLETAFVESVGHRPSQKRDTLMVFDNSQNGGVVNSATYYRFAGNWYRDAGLGTGNPVANADVVFAPSTGVIVRKYTSTGETAFWKNEPTY